jgi:hypothetical protein
MNAKKAKTIRRLCGDDKKSARRMRHDNTRALTSAAQQPKNIGTGPNVPVGRPANGVPSASAPQDKPLRAILNMHSPRAARILIANALHPMDCGRDPIKFLANGPRTRANAVLQQLRAA